MKIRPLALRNGNEIRSNNLEDLRTDHWSLSAHGGDIFAKTVTATGPQTAQGPGGPMDTVPPVISLTSGVAYTQNFDSLATSGITNSLGIDGWTMNETGAGARDNDQYGVDTGGSNTGDTYSYGSAPGGIPSTERALGELDSSSLISTFGASFTNGAGATITALQISYDGEQWRVGGAHTTIAEGLDFQISFDATSLTTGQWFDINNLDFLPVIASSTASALDGNNALNRTAISFNVTTVNGNAVSVANGATFWIRWVGHDATGGDDGLAIDNFSITASTAAGPGALSINDVSHAEGDAGATTYTFTVTRSGGSAGAVTVDYTISAPGGATFADSTDFVAGSVFSGQVSFADGETSRTITIDVQGDDLVETNETFTVTLSNATGGATISDATGIGTITNDDQIGTLAINDVVMAEGDSGTTNFVFTVTRSGGDDGAISADYTINLPGGVGGADATDIPGTLTGTVNFADGEISKTIIVGVAGDTVFEPSESFSVTLSNPTGGTSFTDDTGAGTIQNDDAAPAGTLSIDDVSHAEGDSGATSFTFTVSRTGGSAGAVTADFVISAPGGAGNADSGDFVPASVFSGTVSFADGEISKTITIDVQGDTSFEPNETFTVTLSNATGGAGIGDGVGIGTITNDDVAPAQVSIGDAAIAEGGRRHFLSGLHRQPGRSGGRHGHRRLCHVGRHRDRGQRLCRAQRPGQLRPGRDLAHRVDPDHR